MFAVDILTKNGFKTEIQSEMDNSLILLRGNPAPELRVALHSFYRCILGHNADGYLDGDVLFDEGQDIETIGDHVRKDKMADDDTSLGDAIGHFEPIPNLSDHFLNG